MILLVLCALAADREGIRLSDELTRLAQDGQWKGVERVYAKLVESHPGLLTGQTHLLAAEAARARGDLLLCLQRLQRVPEDDEAYLHARSGADWIAAETRLVALTGSTLAADALPFAPELRTAAKHAQDALAERGHYVGLLPAGSYAIDGVPLDVQPGLSWLVVSE